jgi:hypothetical protein
MVSIRKLLINVVITQQAKEADRLEPKRHSSKVEGLRDLLAWAFHATGE